jgi:hypothetical protein
MAQSHQPHLYVDFASLDPFIQPGKILDGKKRPLIRRLKMGADVGLPNPPIQNHAMIYSIAS